MPRRVGDVFFFLLLILLATIQPVAAEVYIKLLPGKELCLNYEGYRDPEDDPSIVDLRHRGLDPRSVNIRTRIYNPSGEQGVLNERIDPYGTPSSLFFKVTETGTYRVCMRTPLSHPPLRFEMRFVGENDLIDPATTIEGVPVVDKPVEVEDYRSRLRMLDICVQVTLDEVRMSENRLHMFDDVTQMTYHITVGMLLLNVALSIGLNVWAEKYLERYFMKKKIV
ncbi:hypothetical protein TraAM80_04281 [Trypanosoma rangeli]|uniref:GOLD domain-containing protein n=1 Tax=Trypanosoma rangeli TaxID=5698 RepID=A0A422NKF6_TRYRA|nr:uncharacterized protein TraAM80_04281 [Trypanosoma rangeli]RNF05945.1 hypothetical protein TraAM80_04281 [Trypanosoma rangeli]|eukprot:RNF05945.1 hypothetical protein TraAM80_04281 [Trypanosoma rangeli]